MKSIRYICYLLGILLSFCSLAKAQGNKTDSTQNEYKLEEVIISDQEKNQASLANLRAVEGTAIYAGKKNEVIVIENVVANLATNNSRQVYAKVAGLNIWESDGAGIQLGIGGRGLSPNRTANFNVRQNGYDISADALGYPESYYTPPTEALKRIEIVRGAASLQYGTQFGGLLNFIMKEGPKDKPIELTLRQTVGSFGLSNSFTSIGGTRGILNYYAFYQYKRGNGWRPNSGFDVHTAYSKLNFQFNEALKLGLEYTAMQYKAQQPGGLTDAFFVQDPRQSIRERNWFRVKWNLAALTLDYKVSPRTKINVRNFGLFAQRDALGFLGRISRVDPLEERNLIHGKFQNIGNETRLIHRYELGANPSNFLMGFRVYRGHTTSLQGFASDGADADFEFLNPGNPENVSYANPSLNLSVFTENIFRISSKFSITPGFRYEYIKTASDGYYWERSYDLAGNLLIETQIPEIRDRARSVFLAGLGLSYKQADKWEAYANFSQNYRAITFSDLRVVNPNFVIDENLMDERGFNADIGIRGKWKAFLQYDISAFFLKYNDKIGSVFQVDSTLFSLYRYRTNVSDARNIGIEAFIEADLVRLLSNSNKDLSISIFSNIALIDARYISFLEAAIDQNKVELVPTWNLKTGLSIRYKDFKANLQHTYVSDQFTEATNAVLTASAVDGLIPAYQVMDLSLSYQYKWLTVEGGNNNVLNAAYFTRRAVSYPGPGIIPADGRSFYIGLQVKL